jgi:hypothetical protein
LTEESSSSATYTLDVLRIDSIGPLYKHDVRPFAWAKVRLSFLLGGDLAIHPSIDLQVPLVYEDGTTIEQIHENIFDAARELITAAGKVLTESDSAAVRRLSAEFEDRQKEP